MVELLPPGLALLVGAALVPVTRGRLRALVVVAAPAAALLLTWLASEGVTLPWRGLELQPLAADALARVFGTAFSLVALLGALFAFSHARATELTAALAYAGGALGVVFAGDWMTLFLCWELMAVGSTVVVWSGGTEKARRAGLRYLAIHLMGGTTLLAGIAWRHAETRSLAVDAVSLDGPGGWLVLAGVLINAGAPPFSAWIADSYPESSPTGMVFLSAFTTKSAVYVLLRCFAGTELLVWIGLWMVFYGILYALLENDMRRILAYSIVNQVGFMVCGAGIGTGLAVSGAAGHAFAHVIYKGLLIMSAGAVLTATGKRLCTDLGGLRKSMPLTTACAIVGALAISAFPLTSGFVTKSLIADAAGEQGLAWVWLLLTAASAGVFLHAGIKFPWFVFFHRDSGLRPKEGPWNVKAALVLASLACLIPGFWPGPLHRILPNAVDVHVYTPEHVVSQLQLLLFAGLAFFLLLPLLERQRTITLDLDWLYRRPGPRAFRAIESAAARTWGALTGAASTLRWPAGLRHAWPLSVTVGLLTAILALLILLADLGIWG